jgi:hypothetical protein
MLLNKAQVWSDNDIPKGTNWNSILEDKLHLANSALVLATPNYLISPWCREELKQLSEAKRVGVLRNLFWVQLRACGWQHTELQELQGTEAEKPAINEYPDEMQRQRAILLACEEFATEIVRSITEEDKQLALVRQLLSDASEHVTVSEVIAKGQFFIVCGGLEGSINVAIKVLRWIPLRGLVGDLLRIAKRRKELKNPSFVRIHNVFSVGPEGEQRTVFISEYMGKTPSLLRSELSAGTPLPVGKVILLLRRLAEGLWQLHQQTPVGGRHWERTLGLLSPDHVYYDRDAERLRVSPIGVSGFLWHVFDCETYADWVDSRSKVYVAPEQDKKPGRCLTPKTDQYMLARLGVEMLEHLPFEQILKLNGKVRDEFWENPECCINGTWKKDR